MQAPRLAAIPLRYYLGLATTFHDPALAIIGPDGRVAFHTPNFRALSQAAYTELATVVDRISPPPMDSVGG